MKLRTELFIILALVIAFSAFIKTKSLHTPHTEGDEQIYLNLVKSLYYQGTYSLRGTPIMPNLSKMIYDKPFFHHPPLFIFLMLPVVHVFDEPTSVIISWLGHFLCILAVFLLLYHFLRDKNPWMIILPTIAVSVDPLLIFTSQKIWFDAFLAGLTAMSIYFFLAGMNHEKRRWYWFFAGVFWGLALLTKMPSAVLFPFFLIPVIWLVVTREERKKTVMDSLFVFIPALLLVLPWFITFYGHYGTLLPNWLKPDPWLIKNNRFIQMVTSRPFYYFFKELFLLTPFFAFIVVMQVKSVDKMGTLESGLWFVFLVTMISLTIIGAGGQSFQMRFITMVIAPIYMLSGILLAHVPKKFQNLAITAFVLGIVWNALTSMFYMINHGYADIYSLPEIL